ncbi:alpha-L-fucosidase [Caulobacter segnis]
MKKYVAAGAKYFMAMANHHDNLDLYDSRHHAWNTTRVGPRRDIVGTWAKVARAHGLKFAVSNHSAHAWHWWQTAYGYDAEGSCAGRGQRYDAFNPHHALQAKGRWWRPWTRSGDLCCTAAEVWSSPTDRQPCSRPPTPGTTPTTASGGWRPRR